MSIHTHVCCYIFNKEPKKNYSYFNIFIFKYVHTYILVRKEKIINISNILWSNLNCMFIFLYVAFFIIDDTHKNKIIVHFSQTIVVRCFFYFEIVYRVFLYSIFFLKKSKFKMSRYRTGKNLFKTKIMKRNTSVYQCKTTSKKNAKQDLISI